MLKLKKIFIFLVLIFVTINATPRLDSFSLADLGIKGSNFIGGYNRGEGVAIDTNNTIWIIGNSGKSLYEFDGKNTPATEYLNDTGADTANPYSKSYLTIGPENNVWILTPQNTIKIFGKGKGNWTILDSASSGLPSTIEGFRGISTDKDGNIWLCAPHEFITKFNGSTWTVYKPDPSDSIVYLNGFAIARDRTIWISSYSGLYRIEKGKFNKVHNLQIENIVKGVDDDIWFQAKGSNLNTGAISKLSTLKPNELVHFDSSNTNGVIADFFNIRCYKSNPYNNCMYVFDNDKGLLKFDGKAFKTCPATKSLKNINMIIFGANQDVWMASDSMLYRYNEGVVSVKHTLGKKLIGKELGNLVLSNNEIYHLYFASNTIGMTCEINVVDISGKLVKKIHSGRMSNSSSIQFSVKDLAQGIYYCSVILDSKQKAHPFVVSR